MTTTVDGLTKLSIPNWLEAAELLPLHGATSDELCAVLIDAPAALLHHDDEPDLFTALRLYGALWAQYELARKKEASNG